MILTYIDPEPLSLAEVRRQCRVDGVDEDELIQFQIIPGARALAENKTGAAIRKARFQDTVALPAALEMGQVLLIESVTVAGLAVAFERTESARRTVVSAAGHEGAQAVVTYTAGISIDQHPGVRSWLLLACGWMYGDREMVRQWQFNEAPRYITDSLLLSINVPGAI